MQGLGGKLLTPEEDRRERSNIAREVFADYGLHPGKYPILTSELDSMEKRGGRNEGTFNCGRRECVVCHHEYYGNANVCVSCYKVYKNESLFWSQGQKIKD